MSVHDRAPQGRFARLCGMETVCRNRIQTLGRNLLQILSGRHGGFSAVPAYELDDKLKRDIGIPADAGLGVSDVRAAFYRNLLQHGRPLP